jgi:AcrR family transcriptional regulator
MDAFARRGYRGASMAQIAESVGITQPGLLHHFPSKQQLLLGIFEHYESRNLAKFQAVMENRSFGDGLREVARQHEEDPSFIRFFTTLTAEALDSEHPAHDWFIERYRGVRGHWSESIRREQAAGRLKEGLDPELLADVLIAVFDGLELQHLREPDAVRILPGVEQFLLLVSSDEVPT